MANISVTYSFTNGSTADADQVNQNFTDIINGTSDGTKDLSVNAITAAGALNANGDVNLGNATTDSITFTGRPDSDIIPIADSSHSLGSTSLRWANCWADTVTGTTATFTSLGGTLTTAAQANVTSLGTLTGLTVNGDITLTTATTPTIASNGNAAFAIQTVSDMIFQIDSDNGETGKVYQFRTDASGGGGTLLMELNDSGNLGIGASPSNKLDVDGGSSAVTARVSTTNTGANAANLTISNSSRSAFADGVTLSHGAGSLKINDLAGNLQLSCTPQSGAPGNVAIGGALSKGSGSFKIPHPLPHKKETHYLVHSFVESPQADNIYRGKQALVGGRAEINIDIASGMTDGSFVLLNREVQVFTTNESGWDLVKGGVSGNILTIESNNSSSTDIISWLVIGERHDEHMFETSWTDEQGKVIVEPSLDEYERMHDIKAKKRKEKKEAK